MIKQKYKKFITAIFILVSVFFIFSHQVQAIGNTRGWAWSENIGWISLNCNNAIEGKPAGTCETIDYGVSIDTSTGKFSGWAWSENIGWINFGPSGPYPTTPNNEATIEIKTVCGDAGTEIVTGWAQVESTKGWIKMSGNNYRVKRDDDIIDNLTGWAWSEDFGWISFNCKNEGCPGANYKVSTFTPTYKPGVVSLIVLQDNCSNNGENPQVQLNWTFAGCKPSDKQTGYRIQIDDDQFFVEPYIIEKEKILPEEPEGSNNFYSTILEDGGKLQYGGITGEKPYYWKVSVQVNGIEWSDFVTGTSFSTPKHPYPQVSLKCSKDRENYRDCKELNVSAGETIYFTGNDPEPCGGGLSLPECAGVVIKKRTWEFGVSCEEDSDCLEREICNINKVCEKTIPLIIPPPGDATLITISRTYFAGSLPEKGLSLEITDSSDYTCLTSGTSFKNSKVNFPLPIWKEVIPKD
jgi:hypothetical protein